MLTRREILRRLALGGLVSPLLLRRAEAAYGFTSASSQYLEAGSAVLTSVPITLACWFYTTSDSLQQTLISLASSTSTEDLFQLALWGAQPGDPLVAMSRRTVQNGIAQSAGAYPVNEWAHAAAVFASTTSRSIWLNGTQVGTNSTSVSAVTLNRTGIGRLSRSTPGDYMQGYIAEPGIWATALTSSEIQGLAKGIAPIKIRPQLLRSYLPMIRENVAPIGAAFTAYNSPTIVAHPRIYR